MRILRARDCVITPWKNGGGTTAEIAAFPPGSDLSNFGWRISVASVERGGPFSLFPGIDRRLALLHGHISLAVAGRDATELTADAPPASFPGDVATSAEVLVGPALDLNVMTRRSLFTSRLKRQKSVAELTLDTAAITALYFLKAGGMRDGNTEFSLSDGDTVLIDSDTAKKIIFLPDVDFYWIEILASHHDENRAP